MREGEKVMRSRERSGEEVVVGGGEKVLRSKEGREKGRYSDRDDGNVGKERAG